MCVVRCVHVVCCVVCVDFRPRSLPIPSFGTRRANHLPIAMTSTSCSMLATSTRPLSHGACATSASMEVSELIAYALMHLRHGVTKVYEPFAKVIIPAVANRNL